MDGGEGSCGVGLGEVESSWWARSLAVLSSGIGVSGWAFACAEEIDAADASRDSASFSEMRVSENTISYFECCQ